MDGPPTASPTPHSEYSYLLNEGEEGEEGEAGGCRVGCKQLGRDCTRHQPPPATALVQSKIRQANWLVSLMSTTGVEPLASPAQPSEPSPPPWPASGLRFVGQQAAAQQP